MSYASQQDIEKQYSAEAVLLVAEDPDNAGQVDTEKVVEACRAASGEIDGYLGSRYDVPLDTTPDNIRLMAVDIALYRMSTEATLTEDRRKRFEDAIRYLERVSDKKVNLSGVELAQPPTPVRTAPVVPGLVSGDTRRFSRATQGGVR